MTYPFFNLLGIAPTQELREIKRAYAVALKKIDQEHEPEAFAALREAYEQAQLWCKGELTWVQTEENDGFLVSSVAFEGAMAPDERFANPSDLVVEPFSPENTGKNPPFKNTETQQAVALWVSRLCVSGLVNAHLVLEQALSDERMLHVEASFELEAQVLNFLHHSEADNYELFDAMALRFGWRHDLRHLQGVEGVDWLVQILNQEALWVARQRAQRHEELIATVTFIKNKSANERLSNTQCALLEEARRDSPELLLLHLGREFWDAAYREYALTPVPDPSVTTLVVTPSKNARLDAVKDFFHLWFKRLSWAVGILFFTFVLVPIFVFLFVPATVQHLRKRRFPAWFVLQIARGSLRLKTLASMTA